MEGNLNNSTQITKKYFIMPGIILIIFWATTYILTLILPHGEMERTVIDGLSHVNLDSYHNVTEGISFWKFLFSPFLVFTNSNNTAIIPIMIFMFIIGGSFRLLNESGIVNYILKKITINFINKRKILAALITLFFLSFGSFLSAFEEGLPMIPFVVALALAMGWDAYTGIIMSLFSCGVGFANGALNPFTTGTMQSYMGLPIFSGLSMRLLTFFLSYIVILLFLFIHINKLEKKVVKIENNDFQFEKDIANDNASKYFTIIFSTYLLMAICSVFIKPLQNVLFILLVVLYLILSIGTAYLSGLNKGKFKIFIKGLFDITPGVLLILLSTSIQYIITEGKILDTIIYYSITALINTPKFIIIVGIFALIMIIDFFVPSGVAEAIILGPILLPLANNLGLSRQLVTLAFNYGDGFSNIYHVTNVPLLIGLSLVGFSYIKWIKKSFWLHLSMFALSCLLLVIGLYVGY